MPMITGSVSIDTAGVETKSGLAESLYDQYKAGYAGTIPAGAAGVGHKEAFAQMANDNATGMLVYMLANAQLKVLSTDSGLQKSTSVGTLTAQPDGDATFGALL